MKFITTMLLALILLGATFEASANTMIPRGTAQFDTACLHVDAGACSIGNMYQSEQDSSNYLLVAAAMGGPTFYCSSACLITNWDADGDNPDTTAVHFDNEMIHTYSQTGTGSSGNDNTRGGEGNCQGGGTISDCMGGGGW